MLAFHKCSDTGIFTHLSSHALCSLQFRKYITYEAHIFFSNCSKFDADFRNGEKIEKIFLFSKIISFELVTLNTHFCGERILVIVSQYVKKQSQDFSYY